MADLRLLTLSLWCWVTAVTRRVPSQPPALRVPASFALVGYPNECACLTPPDKDRQTRLEAFLAASPRAALLPENYDSYNHSLLNMAARYGNVPAVDAIIRAGAADMRHRDQFGGHTPLHHIMHCQSCSETIALKVTRMLLDAGISAHRQDLQRVTPVQKARGRKWTSVVKLLEESPGYTATAQPEARAVPASRSKRRGARPRASASSHKRD